MGRALIRSHSSCAYSYFRSLCMDKNRSCQLMPQFLCAICLQVPETSTVGHHTTLMLKGAHLRIFAVAWLVITWKHEGEYCS